MTLSERLELHLPDVKDAALREEMLRAAVAYVHGYTGREDMNDVLELCALQIACIYVNRMGMEGERVHTEDSVKHTVYGDVPEDIRRVLGRYRRVATIAAHEGNG